MARANSKGREGENELIEFLNELFKEYGYEWYRTPSQERNKRTRHGDVNLCPRKKDGAPIKTEECVLYNFLWDAQKSNHLTPTAKLKKGIDELEGSGRRHAIYYGKETSGTGTPNFEMIAMTPKTFRYIIKWLQSFVELG